MDVAMVVVRLIKRSAGVLGLVCLIKPLEVGRASYKIIRSSAEGRYLRKHKGRHARINLATQSQGANHIVRLAHLYHCNLFSPV